MLDRLRTAFSYPLSTRASRRPLFQAGVWFFVCPPLGWILALGYRAEAAWHLWDSPFPKLPALPPLKRGLLLGSKALAVILCYLSPVVMLYWILGLKSLADFWEHWVEVLGMIAFIPAFLPVTLPAIALGAPSKFEWLHYSPVEAVVLTGCFTLVIFCLPAAFLQVSVTRKFRSALHLPGTLTLIAGTPRLYCEAWAISLAATILALCAVPILPWAIVWSYLVIGYAFNDALARMNLPELREKAAGSCFGKKAPPKTPS